MKKGVKYACGGCDNSIEMFVKIEYAMCTRCNRPLYKAKENKEANANEKADKQRSNKGQ